MSNEFDKEVAAKIADRAIAEARKESEEKYGIKDVTISWDDIKYKNGWIYHESDVVFLEDQTNNLPKEEISKIDFYRQKVQQYEAVENLIQSIECELEDVFAAKLELVNVKTDKLVGHDEGLTMTYNDMETTYQSCLTCLKDLLKRL